MRPAYGLDQIWTCYEFRADQILLSEEIICSSLRTGKAGEAIQNTWNLPGLVSEVSVAHSSSPRSGVENPINRGCQECGTKVDHLPTLVEYEGQEIFLFDPVICKKCLLELCDTFSVKCENCGGSIPPYSQVGVLKAENGKREFIHMNTACSTVGSAFYGYWGKGKLHNFIEIEAC